VRIAYVWRDKPIIRGGKTVLGKARKISGLPAFLASEDLDTDNPAFFVIEIDKTYWPSLSENEREALVDHELTHCIVDEDEGTLKILPHDLEEFYFIVKRHGLWSEEYKLWQQPLIVIGLTQNK